MTKILMTVYGITAEQAAARLPAAQFVLTAAVAACSSGWTATAHWTA